MNVGRHTQVSDLAALPSHSWTGYIWLSDQDTPRVLHDEPCDLSEYETAEGPTNPFVVEANLYSETEACSVSIRHADGRYRIDQVDWDAGTTDGETVVRPVLGCGALGEKKLAFREAWVPEIESACDDMETLVSAWVGFVGFCSGGEES